MSEIELCGVVIRGLKWDIKEIPVCWENLQRNDQKHRRMPYRRRVLEQTFHCGAGACVPADPTDAVRCCARYNAAIKGVVPVYFSADRVVTAGPGLQLTQIAYGRAATNTFGYVTVSIRIVHKMGDVETPKTSWFGLKKAQDDRKHLRIEKLYRLSSRRVCFSHRNSCRSVLPPQKETVRCSKQQEFCASVL
ncbi:hypothetical protein [Bradyrhizobium sp. CCGE-LA001]|uniref:hypothetical protein n=1 Tax=Bradyrhizobium sp. CCGE-LA001 TaxID=1223566 RepID=UPI0002AA81A8|nr:hypothetical protein [Bradyrhizobium sp. CCGE-LA001]AMA60033.1 hypothetical protein BCCGELA001_29885 [Bradyrhizobium sp. CCGE-LA001]